MICNCCRRKEIEYDEEEIPEWPEFDIAVDKRRNKLMQLHATSKGTTKSLSLKQVSAKRLIQPDKSCSPPLNPYKASTKDDAKMTKKNSSKRTRHPDDSPTRHIR